MSGLPGMSVVITGASSGIGRATALAFAEGGASLTLASRRGGKLAEVARACERRGGRAQYVETDVTDPAAMRALAAAAVRRYGRIDTWVNNAGVGVVGRFTDTPVEAHDQVIRTNLMGYLHGAHAALPHFLRRRRGVLINVVSFGAFVGSARGQLHREQVRPARPVREPARRVAGRAGHPGVRRPPRLRRYARRAPRRQLHRA